MNYMKTFTTLQGLTLSDAIEELQKLLPVDAYSEMYGSTRFTDISPAYLTGTLTDVFGLAGVGWGYTYDPDLVAEYSEVRTVPARENRAEYDRTVHTANVKKLEFWYAYVTQDGNILKSLPIPSSGYSENDNPGYALRGALTNAIGSACAKLTWQLNVYKGIVTHNNVASLWKEREVSDKVGPALKVIVPKIEGLPENYADLTFENILEMKDGQAVVAWLTGTKQNKDKVKFVPKTDAEKKVKESAVVISFANRAGLPLK